MANGMISAVDSPGGIVGYLLHAPAHDQTNPAGPSKRFDFVSTLGDCSVETFNHDVDRTIVDYGQANLDREMYHLLISWSNEEFDPTNEYHGSLAHQAGVKAARRALPGRQGLVITSRDNGRWEVDRDTGVRAWVPGKWHSHIPVANVAEEEVLLEWTGKDGETKTKRYAAGRAIDGDLKNIHRIQGIIDDVVMEEFGYDNQAYVKACGEFSRAQERALANRADFAQRADRGYSNYDEVRLSLDVALAQAVDWDDYTARIQAEGVHVRVTGRSGVSYSWVGGDGVERKARARSKTGLGTQYTKAEVEARCVENAAALARGEKLEVPERILVAPSTSMAAQRPTPIYLTEDGRPPWDSDEARAEYAERVRQSGGTYEGRAAQALVSDAPVEGVELRRDGDAVTATVNAGAGPLVLDVDRELTARAARVESEWALLAQAAEEQKGEWVALAQEQGTLDARTAEIDGKVDEARQQAELIVVEARTKAAAIEAEAKRREESGYSAGYQAGSAEGRAEGRVAGRKERLAEMEPEVDAAKADRADAAASLARQRRAEADLAERLEREEAEGRAEADRRVADYEAEQKAKVPAYDPKAAEEHAPAELIRNVKRLNADGSLRSGPDDPKERLTTKLHAMGVANHKKDRTGVSEKQFMTETTTQRGERIRETTAKLAGQSEAQSKQKQAGYGR